MAGRMILRITRECTFGVITGAGSSFCAGLDLELLIGWSVAEKVSYLETVTSIFRRVWSLPQPVIAAVNGLAYGGGCEIVEATHLSIAVPEAKFSKAEIAIGIPPCFGGTQRLPRLIGRKRALRMILTGEPITAVEAKEAGLINAIVDKEKLLDEAVELGSKVAQFAPEAVAVCLHAVHRGLNATIDEGLAIEAEAFAKVVPTAATKEALNKFVEAHS